MAGSEDSPSHPLLAAVLRRQAAKVERLLGEQPQLAHELGPGGLSAMWAAAAAGDAALVRRLAAAGADVEARIEHLGASPLIQWLWQQRLPSLGLKYCYICDSRPIHAAACGGHVEAVQALLAAGAVGGKVTGDSHLPLQTARLISTPAGKAMLAALCAADPESVPAALRFCSTRSQPFVLQQLELLHSAGKFQPSVKQLVDTLLATGEAKCESAWHHFLPLAAGLSGVQLKNVLPYAVCFPDATAQLRQLLEQTAHQLNVAQAVTAVADAADESARHGASLEPLRLLVGALGQRLTIECIHHIVRYWDSPGQLAVEALQLVLGLVRPQLPVATAEQPLECHLEYMGYPRYPCPLHNLLHSHTLIHQDLEIAGCNEQCHLLLLMVEALAAAGYRPRPYTHVRVPVAHGGEPVAAVDWDPVVERPADFDIHGVNKYVSLAAQGEPWSLDTHACYPPAFQAAARTLLLAAGDSVQRQRRRIAALGGSDGRTARATGRAQQREGGQQPVCPLATLPPPLLLRIVGQAAYPLSAWL